MNELKMSNYLFVLNSFLAIFRIIIIENEKGGSCFGMDIVPFSCQVLINCLI